MAATTKLTHTAAEVDAAIDKADENATAIKTLDAAVTQFKTDLPGVKLKHYTGLTTGATGLVNFANGTAIKYVISVASETAGCYISKVFQNAYKMWYAEAKNWNDDTAFSSSKIDLCVLYIANE